MGNYANIKRNRVRKKLFKWLAKKNGIEIVRGGNHQYLIKYSYWDRPYPIPFKHGEVNKYIIKDLMQKLVNSQICTQEEFDNNI